MPYFNFSRFLGGPSSRFIRLMSLLLLGVSAASLQARDWDTSFEDYDVTLRNTDDSVTVTPSTTGSLDGMTIDFKSGGGSYPGIRLLPPEGEVWNFSEFTCLDVTLTSLGPKPLYATVRVDNPGHWKEKPWNNESARLVQGDTKRIRIFFGYSSRKPGHPLDLEKISAIQIFTGKASEGQKLKIDSIKLGKVPVPYKPNVKPIDGYLLGESAKNISRKYVARDGAKYGGGNGSAPLNIQFNGDNQSLAILPVDSPAWDLRDGYQLEISLRNAGQTPANPAAKATSAKGDTDLAKLDTPLAPGEEGTLVVHFIRDASMDVSKGRDNPFFENNKAKGVVIMANQADQQKLEVSSIRLTAPPVKLPDWVGKGPPVEGNWKMTFSEEFEGETLDATKWRIYAPNYWDKISRFSKDNVQLRDGNAVLIFEKKAGPHNDDPDHVRHNNYTTGYLDTYGKWVQKYGYFEARMKLPEAPGLWPAFWLMPDRGVDAGPQWKRQDIGNGGMEFDIMEYLTGWGPHRFTTAFHYDGYGKDHKATGAGVHTGRDEEGYITTGLLWLPGLAVVYNNGKEVARWETDRISDVESNIIFTHVAGGWDNEPLDDKKLPGYFEIDYVRVWQRSDLASDVDGYQEGSVAATEG